MSDELMVIAMSVVVIVLCVVGLSWSENKDAQAFAIQCKASGFTQAQCAILEQQRVDDENAQIAAGAAMGMAAHSMMQRK